MSEQQKAHATLGASSSERWMACAGSVRLSEGMPDRPSVYKQEGSAAHDIAARALEKGVDPDVWLDTIVEVKDGDPPQLFPITITEEMVEAAQVYVDYVRERIRLYEEAGFEVSLHVETRFNLAPMNPPAPMYGTADAVLFLSGRQTAVEVVDFKYGQGVAVEADENSQLRYYALGAVLTHERKVDRIRTTIVQPRAPHPDGIMRHETIGWADLVAFKQELFERARATQDPDAPLNPGDHCRFCPALPVCPAQQKLAEEAAQEEFVNMPVVTTPVPAPTALTIVELRRAMELKPLIENWLSAVAEHVKLLTEGGVDLGYKLVPKRGYRRWVDEEATGEFLEERLGEDAYKRKLRSPAQAEQALKKLGVGLPEDMWVKLSSGTNLVPHDDPRPAIEPAPSAEDEFQADPFHELRLVEEGYKPDTKNAAAKVTDDIEIPEWEILPPGDPAEGFHVHAANETDARREARRVLGRDRLPNHTTVTQL